jgi:hypothetical protein
MYFSLENYIFGYTFLINISVKAIKENLLYNIEDSLIKEVNKNCDFSIIELIYRG